MVIMGHSVYNEFRDHYEIPRGIMGCRGLLWDVEVIIGCRWLLWDVEVIMGCRGLLWDVEAII